MTGFGEGELKPNDKAVTKKKKSSGSRLMVSSMVQGLGRGQAWVAEEGRKRWQAQLELGSPTERMMGTPEIGGGGGW